MCEFISFFISVKYNKIVVGDPKRHSDAIVYSGIKDWREAELVKDGVLDIRCQDSDDKSAYIATVINLIGPKLTLRNIAKKYSPSKDEDGNIYYWNSKGLHRDKGPAYVGFNGTKEYWVNGLRHRDKGPAIILSNGIKEYWVNGKLVKTD